MSQDRSPPLSTYPSSTFEQRMHPAAIIADDEHRADSARIPFASGELLAGVYEVRDALGQGGMGVVFEAQDRLLSRRVAIKVSHPGVDPKYLRLEAQAMAAVPHPNTVAVHAFGTHRGIDFMVMERLYGVTLRAHTRRLSSAGQTLTVRESVDIMLSLADALSAIHRAQLAHRDIKPSNVLLAPGNRVVLMDFGLLVREAYDGAHGVAGSPAYMAPEVILGRNRPGAWHLADLYSLGVVAFEMLSGRKAFSSPDVRAITEHHSAGRSFSLAAERPDLPSELSFVVDSLLAHDPEERPPSAELLVRQLRSTREALGGRLAQAVSRPFTVLIVDDDPAMVALLSACVRQVSPRASVLTAHDGGQAVELVRRALPDVVLLDLQMPTMNGIEVCMHLRATPLTERTTIVSVSGTAQSSDLQLLQQLGIVHFVAKGPDLRPKMLSVLGPLHRAAQV
jgi:serine/threonine protein kinase